MTTLDKNGTIKSLQALRGLAFLGIFLQHSGGWMYGFAWSELGVATFFILSGFLLTLRNDNVQSFSPIKNFIFMIKKIVKIYPLHILTMLCAMYIERLQMLEYATVEAINAFQKQELIVNVLLIQTWYKKGILDHSFNAVAWYLSVTVFLYFMFPAINKILKKCKELPLILVCILLLAAEVFVFYGRISNYGVDDSIYMWIMYTCPVTRLLDFFAGCVIGKIYANHKDFNLSYKQWTFIEVITIVATAVVYYFYRLEHVTVLTQAIFNYTTLFIPLGILWVYAFAVNNGFLTKIFSGEAMISLGNISMQTYLIHYIIVIATNYYVSSHFIDVTDRSRTRLIFMEFILTIFISVVYKYAEAFIRKSIKRLMPKKEALN